MPEKWTNKSRPPSSGVMKPKPLSSENHLTVPEAMLMLPFPTSDGALGAPVTTGRIRPVPTLTNLFRTRRKAQGTVGIGRSSDLGLREVVRGRGDLLAIAGRRSPRQSQGIAGVARDHVQVEVEHRLPRRAAARVEHVDAVRAEPLADERSELLRRRRARVEVLAPDLQQVLRVLARDHEQVPARRRVDVHECDGSLVLANERGGDLARHDLAEQAIGVSHRRTVLATGRPGGAGPVSGRARARSL